MISAYVNSCRAKANLHGLVISLLLLAGSPALAGGKQVRLLIPVLTGTELDQVRKLAPTAVIVTINGETFLEVGMFSDARVAHRLGRSIQKHLSIPFDLAYDPGHPQIELALGDEPQKKALPVAQRPTVVKPVAVLPVHIPAKTDPFWQPMEVGLQAAKIDLVLATSQQSKHPEAVEQASPVRSDPTNDRIDALKPQPKPFAQPEPVLSINLPDPEPLVQADSDSRLTSVEALTSSEFEVGDNFSDGGGPTQAVDEVPVEAIPAVGIAASTSLPDPQLEPQISADVAPAQGYVEPYPALAAANTDDQPFEASSAPSSAVAVGETRAQTIDLETEPLLTGNAERLLPEMKQDLLAPQGDQQTKLLSSIVSEGVISDKSHGSPSLDRRAEAAPQQVPAAAAPESSEPLTALQRPAPMRVSGRLISMKRQHARPRPRSAQPSSTAGVARPEVAPAQAAVKSHPWLRNVNIASVKIDAPLSSIGVAQNPNLNYLYVKIQNPTDVARLNRITPVMELNPVGDSVVARVGVYTKTRTGRRLLEAQIKQLKHQQVDLIVADGGRSLDEFSEA